MQPIGAAREAEAGTAMMPQRKLSALVTAQPSQALIVHRSVIAQ